VGALVEHVISLPVAIAVFALVCAAELPPRRDRSAPERA
jgi:hypothetical protein